MMDGIFSVSGTKWIESLVYPEPPCKRLKRRGDLLIFSPFPYEEHCDAGGEDDQATDGDYHRQEVERGAHRGHIILNRYVIMYKRWSGELTGDMPS